MVGASLIIIARCQMLPLKRMLLLVLIAGFFYLAGCSMIGNKDSQEIGYPLAEEIPIVPQVVIKKTSNDEILGGKIIENLNQLVLRAGFSERIVIKKSEANPSWCSLEGPTGAVVRRNENNVPIIFVSRYFSSEAIPNNALRAVLAHEVGHLALGHVIIGFGFSEEYWFGKNECEARADLYAIRLVGRRVFSRGFRAMNGDAGWRFKR